MVWGGLDLTDMRKCLLFTAIIIPGVIFCPSAQRGTSDIMPNDLFSRECTWGDLLGVLNLRRRVPVELELFENEITHFIVLENETFPLFKAN